MSMFNTRDSGSIRVSRVLFGVPPNRSFRRNAPAAAGRGRVRSPILRVCEKRERCGILVARGGAQRNRNSQGFEKSLEIEVMLLGEDLRGRHQRRLLTRLDAEKHGAQRDERFSRSDIAVQQTIHWTRRGEIGCDFSDGPLLRAGQREGQ